MANRNQGPFWNQDAVMAAGLAFAGMAVLQSKLFPAASWMQWPLLRALADSKIVEWWPLLLIVAGVALWVGKSFEQRWQKAVKPVANLGGQHGNRRHEN